MATIKKKNIPGADLVKADLESVEKRLREEAGSDVALVMEMGHHILGSGGKRFRPMVALLCGKMIGMLLCGKMIGMKKKKELVSYAAGMEFAHTSTLLHDDVIDEADIRRGEEAANRIWGNAPAIIVGDYLLFKSFSLMLAGDNLRVVEFMTRIAVEMAEGEAYQLSQKSRVDLTEEQYERIIKAKTALLIQASCQVPAIAMGSPKKIENALSRFGYNLGLAFQIVDDVLDYSATDAKWGKEIGKDFMEGKTTLPLIIAHQRSGKKDRGLLKELFHKKNRNTTDLGEVLSIIDKTAAIDEAGNQARQSVEKAKKELKIFPDNEARQALSELADFVINRTI